MAAGGPGILFVGNQAGQRSDECAQAADIHTDEQGQIIPGKAGMPANCSGTAGGSKILPKQLWIQTLSLGA